MFSYIDFIKKDFKTRQSRNSKFSIRSYAKFLDVGVTSLFNLLNENKNLSVENAMKVAKKLKLTNKQIERMMIEISNDKFVKSERFFNEEKIVEEIISEWHYFAILNLATLNDQPASYAHYAKRLGIEEGLVKDSIEKLIKLELLEEKDGVFIRTTRPLKMNSNIPSEVIRTYHKNNMKLAHEKMYSENLERRQFQARVFTVDSTKYNMANALIEKFFNELSSKLEGENPNEVYTISLQLFPNTKEL